MSHSRVHRTFAAGRESTFKPPLRLITAGQKFAFGPVNSSVKIKFMRARPAIVLKSSRAGGEIGEADS